MQDSKLRRKTILRSCLFFLLLLVMIMIFSSKMQAAAIENDDLVQSRNKGVYRILREPDNSIDVIAVGDSLSYSSISPMELWKDHGMTSYVCAQSGQNIQESYHMLQTAFETQSPKLVILEIHPAFREKVGFKGVEDTLVELGNHYVPLFRCHDMWKTIVTNKSYKEESFKGFEIRPGIQPYEKGDYMQQTDDQEELSDDSLSYLELIQELCEENDATLLLLATPSPANYTYRRYNCMNNFAESHSLDYLDLNLKTGEIGIDWQNDTLDGGDHLNLSGAKKVTMYLGTYIASNYDIPDHRDEAAYSQWEKEAAIYTAKAGN